MRCYNLLIYLASILWALAADAQVTVGAARTADYLPLMQGKRVALLSNHTGMVGDEHTLDLMLRNGVNVTTIFSPEHGFRGTADAGEHVAGGKDVKTGIPIASLYDGRTRMPAKSVMDNIDVIAVDIQDVGLRFYTYYCTMIDLMNAAARYGKEFIVLDRPNPNGMSVDGPVLDMKYASGVGRLPIPTLHGMTLGELAMMANGEGWLKDGKKVKLSVIPCTGYTHATRYRLPVPPSPNLPDMKAVYMYPSTCYFEATPVSLGRGTDTPFTVYGHPQMKAGDYYFTPDSRPGAKNPPQLGKRCRGRNLRSMSEDDMIAQGVNFEYVIDAYNAMGRPKNFFTSFFELLAGNAKIRQMIESGASAEQIRATWSDDVKTFKAKRKPYLLYPES
ncbi:MAG: DUF1343 domain-containing protein [Bacteroidales bacterium]|nr:DUF1343 domain-containing protein [Bacteroidales bacterium]